VSDTHCGDCGSTNIVGAHQNRSDRDHNMFHAVIQRAYESWPETAKFQPSSKDHLYGWLLIEAGHSESAEVESDDRNEIIRAGRAFFKLVDRSVHCRRMFGTPSGVRISVSKSLAKKAEEKRVFEDVRSKVYEIIESILGVPIETLKREAEKEAA
jgi:hypothetical protein